MRRLLLAAILAASLPTIALAGNTIPGPITAHVVNVYDGDTITVDAFPWPDVTIRNSVRLSGVDTPEINGECQAEKDLAVQARDFVRAQVGDTVQLRNIRFSEYAGRVVADVWIGDHDLAALIIAAGLGREYHGGAREGWCSS